MIAAVGEAAEAVVIGGGLLGSKPPTAWPGAA